MALSTILLFASVIHAIVSTVLEPSAIDENPAAARKLSPRSYAAVSLPFGVLLLIMAVNTGAGGLQLHPARVAR
jgi:hypothetical protein